MYMYIRFLSAIVLLTLYKVAVSVKHVLLVSLQQQQQQGGEGAGEGEGEEGGDSPRRRNRGGRYRTRVFRPRPPQTEGGEGGEEGAEGVEGAEEVCVCTAVVYLQPLLTATT